MEVTPENTPQIAIIADDLTSAADGASPFRTMGLSCEIFRSQVKGATTEVVAVDTKSRSLTAREAAPIVSDAMTELRSSRILFKTIDSTLRGHVAAEVAAAFQASGRSRLVIAPCFPSAGRITVDGIQLIDGCPVDQTIYGSDPVHPARTSRIADLLNPDIGNISCIPVPMPSENIENILTQSKVLILDAKSQNDLNFRINQIPQKEDILWVGSPGMATALADLYPQQKSILSSFSPRRVLVVVGSANPVSRQQVDEIRAAGVIVANYAKDLSSGSEIACLTAPKTRQENSENVLATLAQEASDAIYKFGYEAVIATGGDTMGAILDKLSINHITLQGEFEAGFPFCSTSLPASVSKQFLIGMKAGGFGKSSTLIDAVYRFLNSPPVRRSNEIPGH